MPFSGDDFRAFERFVGLGLTLDPAEAIRWAVPAMVALLFALESRWRVGRWIGAGTAVLLGYAAAAQVTPPALVPLLPAAGVALLGWTRRSDAATFTAAALALGWVVEPLAHWLFGATGATVGFPLYRSALPTVTEAATRLLAPALAAALVLWRHPPQQRQPRHVWAGAVALLGVPAVHIAWRQLFGIDNWDRFVALGLAERTVWEALLALAAAAAWRWRNDLARALGLASLAHLAWFTLVLHNPLWSQQAVGALPVFNLLLPVYGLGCALLWAAGRTGLPALAERARGWGQMLLIGLFAASELRQLAHGSTLSTGGLSQAEDIARSIVAVGVAVGFLLWGIRRRNVDWRVASLAVMLGAVLKVFLLDTSGLDGLLRIASFAALGFSLIGIGWLYSRYLPDAGAAVNLPSAASA